LLENIQTHIAKIAECMARDPHRAMRLLGDVKQWASELAEAKLRGAGEPVACLRRQKDGSGWTQWQPGTVEEGQHVTGLRSWQVRWLTDAAPQASAEARNAALEEAAN